MDNKINWSHLLQSAVKESGLIMKAYSLFHNYSYSNQIAAIVQCSQRGIEPSPLNTYQGWQALKRQVKKGAKAIELCMPLTRSRTNDDGEKESFAASFVWKARWFVLSQTEGEPIAEIEIPSWSRELALMNLNITEIAFDLMTGNTQGFARKRSIAVSPLAQLPHKTRFHELAHVVLGHTAQADFEDGDLPERNLQEVEAESVALLLCESLELSGADYCRGYIQNWIRGEEIPERSAQRIFGAADRILKAGRNQATIN
jgi:hypothetical protein